LVKDLAEFVGSGEVIPKAVLRRIRFLEQDADPIGYGTLSKGIEAAAPPKGDYWGEIDRNMTPQAREAYRVPLGVDPWEHARREGLSPRGVAYYARSSTESAESAPVLPSADRSQGRPVTEGESSDGVHVSLSSTDSPLPAVVKPWIGSIARVQGMLHHGTICPFASLPRERLLHNPDILPMLEMALRSFLSVVRICVYTVDKVILESFTSRLRRGEADGWMILDENQCNNPSCSSQRAAMLNMKEWGVHMRTRRPKPGMTSAQHEKTWLFDEALLVVGSANASFNSMTKCEETVIATRSKDLITAQAIHFDKIWETAKEIDWDKLKLLEEQVTSSKVNKSLHALSYKQGLYTGD